MCDASSSMFLNEKKICVLNLAFPSTARFQTFTVGELQSDECQQSFSDETHIGVCGQSHASDARIERSLISVEDAPEVRYWIYKNTGV